MDENLKKENYKKWTLCPYFALEQQIVELLNDHQSYLNKTKVYNGPQDILF